MSRGPGVRRLGVMARLTRLDIPANIAKRRRAAEEQSDDENEGGGEEGRDRERKDTAENREKRDEERENAGRTDERQGSEGEKSREIQRTRDEKKVNEWTEK